MSDEIENDDEDLEDEEGDDEDLEDEDEDGDGDDEDLEDEDEDGDGDDEDLEDEDEDGEDEDGGSEHAYSFFEETEAVIVAGKAFDIGGFSRKDLGTFGADVDAIAQKHGLKIMAVPAGDLTDTGPSPDDDVYSVLHVGLLAACGGSYAPEQISRAQVLATLEKAQNIPAEVWAEIGEKLGEKQRKAYDNAEFGLHFTCVGPLSAATLAFGVLRKREDENEAADGCELHYGQNMEQDAHEQGVWGIRLCYVQYEGPESEPLDLSDEAHQKLVETCKDPAADYYIFARYD